MRPSCAGGERGAGLVLALVILLITGILAAAAASAVKTLMRDSLYQGRALEAQALAETGGEAALARLSRDRAWRQGFRGKGFSKGSFDVTLSSGPNPVVTATGLARPLVPFGRTRRTVSFRVRLLPVPSMPYAAAAEESLLIMAGRAAVDSYDSRSDKAPAEFGRHGDVATNRDLAVAGSGEAVLGDATYRTGGEPPPDAVSGAVQRVLEPFPMPLEDGSAFAEDHDNLSGIAPSALYDPGRRSLTVPAGSTAAIRSGVYHLASLRVDGTLRARISDGPVVIFVAGYLRVSGAIENPSRIPANLILYGVKAGETWTFSGSAPLHGVVYAPLAEVVVGQTVFGALAAKKLSLLSGSIHYDLALRGAKSGFPRLVPGTWTAGLRR
ncbi:MAG: hypothetical protein HY924_07415 [Elusimicrobia bacterium]|nr:hypothetical protein [Elusimicrobiota bacterium]